MDLPKEYDDTEIEITNNDQTNLANHLEKTINTKKSSIKSSTKRKSKSSIKKSLKKTKKVGQFKNTLTKSQLKVLKHINYDNMKVSRRETIKHLSEILDATMFFAKYLDA